MARESEEVVPYTITTGKIGQDFKILGNFAAPKRSVKEGDKITVKGKEYVVLSVGHSAYAGWNAIV